MNNEQYERPLIAVISMEPDGCLMNSGINASILPKEEGEDGW